MKKTSLLMVLLIGMLFCSCKKDAPNLEHSTSSSSTFESGTSTIILDGTANPDNPYDYIGQEHNKLLDYAINNYKTDAGFYANDTFHFSGLINLMKIEASNGIIDDKEGYLEDTSYLQMVFAHTQTWSLDSNSLSQNALNYYQSIQSAISSVPDFSNTDNISDCISNIKNIETEILGSSLDNNEKTALLCTASVARYSVAYWHSTLNNPNSGWNNLPGVDIPMDASSAASCAAADAEGALEGLAVALVTGEVFGPEAALACAAVASAAWTLKHLPHISFKF